MITGPASYPRKLLSFPIKRSCLSLGKEIRLPTQALLLESRDLLGINGWIISFSTWCFSIPIFFCLSPHIITITANENISLFIIASSF